MKYLILLLALAISGCGILPQPTEHNLSKRYSNDMNNSKHVAKPGSVTITNTTANANQPHKPTKPPFSGSCKKSHKGKCKNDNFKNGHYKK
jgi:hypothetical protein